MNPNEPTPSPDPRDPLERPSLQAALALLVPAAICSGLFYLWLGKLAESLVYGCLLGGGLAAMVVEFIKYSRSLRDHPGENGNGTDAMRTLFLAAFRLGFMRTAKDLARALASLFGFKLLASALGVVIVYLIARAGHLF